MAKTYSQYGVSSEPEGRTTRDGVVFADPMHVVFLEGDALIDASCVELEKDMASLN